MTLVDYVTTFDLCQDPIDFKMIAVPFYYRIRGTYQVFHFHNGTCESICGRIKKKDANEPCLKHANGPCTAHKKKGIHPSVVEMDAHPDADSATTGADNVNGESSSRQPLLSNAVGNSSNDIVDDFNLALMTSFPGSNSGYDNMSIVSQPNSESLVQRLLWDSAHITNVSYPMSVSDMDDDAMHTATRTELNDLRNQTRTELNELRNQTRTELNELRNHQTVTTNANNALEEKVDKFIEDAKEYINRLQFMTQQQFDRVAASLQLIPSLEHVIHLIS